MFVKWLTLTLLVVVMTTAVMGEHVNFLLPHEVMMVPLSPAACISARLLLDSWPFCSAAPNSRR
jgi:hypothetical protein